MKISKGTWIRTAVLFLALINHFLTVLGKAPLPFDDVMVEQFVAFGFDAVAGIIAWWKNNSFTKKARKADAVLRDEERDEKLPEGVVRNVKRKK